MASSYVSYTGDGSTTDFNVTFDYLSRSHVVVLVAGVQTTAFTWLSDTQIRLTPAPANAAAVKLQRITPRDARLVNFQNGSTINADTDLDTDSNQLFFLTQEAYDNAATGSAPSGTISTYLIADDAVTAAKIAPITPAGGTTARNIEDTQGDIPSVKNMGAVGDGITDDTAALQAALNLGRGVYVPDGTYLFSSLTIPSNVHIMGSGTLKLKTTAGITSGEKFRIDATGASNWSMEGITLDGNRAGQSGSAGFRVTGILLRNGSDIRIEACTFKNWHEGCIEATTATQNNPIDADTPGAQPVDTIRRLNILGCTFKDSGQNADTSGFGYSDSIIVQIGSSTEDVTVADCLIYNCLSGILAAAYNKRLTIADNKCYVDSATYTYRGAGIAVEQMSDGCTVEGNTVVGFREGYNIESPLRTTVVGNKAINCLRGINCFASSIGGVPINMREVVIANNTIRGATNEGIKVSKSSGAGAYDIVVEGNVVNGGTYGINAVGLTRANISCNAVTAAASGIQLDSLTDSLAAGNLCSGNTAEGIYVNACTRTTVRGGQSSGNDYGIYIAAGQTSLVCESVTLLNNTTKDLRIDTPDSNNVRLIKNTYVTSTHPQKTITGDGASLQWAGDTVLLTAGTYTNFTGLQPDRSYCFIALGAVTLSHNAAVVNKIWTQSHSNISLVANDTRKFTSDGTYLYEC